MSRKVVVVAGPGRIGQAIARRVGVGKHVLLADRSEANAKAAPDVLGNARYDVGTATVDVFAQLEADPAAALDGVNDMANQPLADEPGRVRSDLNAIRAQRAASSNPQ